MWGWFFKEVNDVIRNMRTSSEIIKKEQHDECKRILDFLVDQVDLLGNFVKNMLQKECV